MSAPTVGEYLRAARLRLTPRATHDAIGQRLQVARAYIEAVKAGRKPPPPGRLRLWCDAVGANYDEAALLAGQIPDDVQAWILADRANLAAVRRLMEGVT